MKPQSSTSAAAQNNTTTTELPPHFQGTSSAKGKQLHHYPNKNNNSSTTTSLRTAATTMGSEAAWSPPRRRPTPTLAAPNGNTRRRLGANSSLLLGILVGVTLTYSIHNLLLFGTNGWGNNGSNSNHTRTYSPQQQSQQQGIWASFKQLIFGDKSKSLSSPYDGQRKNEAALSILNSLKQSRQSRVYPLPGGSPKNTDGDGAAAGEKSSDAADSETTPADDVEVTEELLLQILQSKTNEPKRKVPVKGHGVRTGPLNARVLPPGLKNNNDRAADVMKRAREEMLERRQRIVGGVKAVGRERFRRPLP